MTRFLLPLCLLVSLFHTTRAQDTAQVRPFVSETTFLLAKVRPQQIQPPDAEKLLGAAPPAAQAVVGELTKKCNDFLGQLRTWSDGQPIYAAAEIPSSKDHRPFYLFRRKTSEQNAQVVQTILEKQLKMEMRLHQNYLVAVSRGESIPTSLVERDLEAAFQATADYPAQLIVTPPSHVWRTLSELSPELPSFLGGGPSRVLTDGVQWASLGFDLQNVRLSVVIQAQSEAAARDFAVYLPKLLRAILKAAAPTRSTFPDQVARALIGSLKPHVEGSQVKILVDGFGEMKSGLGAFAALSQVLEEKVQQIVNNDRKFKQILLGMHNYHDVHRVLPPADKHRDKGGRLGLSWRVHLLPYVEQQALYEQFHLDEPWNSPHNKKLLEKMPDIFALNTLAPAAAPIQPGHTTFLAPVGERTVFGGEKSTRFTQITDGFSHVIVLVETTPEKAVPWTAPEDFSFDPKNPLQGVWVGKDGKWRGGFADGSVRKLSAKLPGEQVLHLFQMNDGHPIRYDVP